MKLCDGITRESENPGSHALIWYLRSELQWSDGEREGRGLRGFTRREGFTSGLVKKVEKSLSSKVISIREFKFLTTVWDHVAVFGSGGHCGRERTVLQGMRDPRGTQEWTVLSIPPRISK